MASGFQIDKYADRVQTRAGKRHLLQAQPHGARGRGGEPTRGRPEGRWVPTGGGGGQREVHRSQREVVPPDAL